MASTAVSDLSALYKEVYPNGLPDLIPQGTKFQQKIEFSEQDALGDKYIRPVRLAYPSGFTHAVESDGAFALNDAIPGTLKEAQLQGSIILLRDQLAYDAAAKASRGGKKAFQGISEVFFGGMQKAMRKRLEAQVVYGAASVGEISAVSVSTNATITLKAASFAPGLWAGMEGMKVDAYDAVSSGAKINTNADLTLVSVDIDERKIVVSGNATDLGNLSADHFLFYKGSYGKEMQGVHYLLTQTSGTVLNINVGTYSLWRGTQHAALGALSFSVIKKAVAKAVGKGLEEDVELMVNPKGWDDLMTDLAALRRIGKGEESKYVLGAESIEFHSQNGKIKITSSIYVKEGNAYGLVTPDWKRVGAVDVTNEVPGFGGKIFFDMPSNAGIESRLFTHQAVICERPAPQFVITGIVNS